MRLPVVLSLMLLTAMPGLAESEPRAEGPRIGVMRVEAGQLIDAAEQDPDHERVMRRLQTPVELGQEQMEFKDAVLALRTQTGLNITVNWAACEIPGIDQETWVQLDVDGLPAQAVLGFMLDFVSSNAFEDDKLGYCERGGAVYISTLYEIKRFTENRVYHIAPLLTEPFRPVGLMYEAGRLRGYDRVPCLAAWPACVPVQRPDAAVGLQAARRRDAGRAGGDD